jgi:Flp pilus assembly protein TadG
MYKLSPSGYSKFRRNTGGNVASAFALMSPVMLIALAAAVDYSNTVSTKQKIQSAADSAALAANVYILSAMASGDTTTITQAQTTQAQTLATNYFNTNAPSAAVTGETQPLSVAPTVSNGLVTTKVTYTGAPTSLLNGYLGSSKTLVTTATATSQVGETSTATAGAGSYAGAGYVLGDPHVIGADGVDTYFACATPSGSWYNMLSDSNFEINVNCVTNTLFDMDAILDITTLVGTHTVQMTSVNPTFTGAQNWVCGDEMCGSYNTVTYPPGSWVGAVTIDGVSYPAARGTNTYLNDKTENVNVTVTVGQSGVASSQSNYVTITTPDYTVNEMYYNVGMGYIAISAQNAGACGVPGGIWGGTLAGVDDGTGTDFLVSNQYYKSYQFYWTNCETVAVSSTPHLTQ